MLVTVQPSVPGLYFPPVLMGEPIIDSRPRRSFHCLSTPPCDSIGQRARWWCWWLSNCRCSGLYLPPVFKRAAVCTPPQTIISLPIHTAV